MPKDATSALLPDPMANARVIGIAHNFSTGVAKLPPAIPMDTQ